MIIELVFKNELCNERAAGGGKGNGVEVPACTNIQSSCLAIASGSVWFKTKRVRGG